MPKSVKKTMTVLSLTTLMLAAACSANNGNTDPVNSGTNEQVDKGSGELPAALGKYDPPITLTAATIIRDDVKFREGENIDNNVLDKTIAEDLGIQMKYLWTASTNDEFKEKLRLSLSANQDLPEMIVVPDKLLFRQLAQSGEYMDIGELFERYADPKWKEAFAKYPEAWNAVTVDGKHMGIPTLNWIGRNQVMWIREDWLEKLKLKAPATMEELQKVMEAFVTQDPDGNGKKDTYGVSLALKDNYFSRWFGSSEFIFGAEGVMPIENYWVKGEDGKLTEPIVTPAMKNGLSTIKDWFAKGYIPKDVGLYDEMKAAELFTSGKAGITFGQYWIPLWPMPDLFKNVPGSKIKAYPVPAGSTGTAKISAQPITTDNFLMIKKDAKHPEAVMAYVNWFYKNYVYPDKGSKYEYGLAEGYDWAVVDGKPTNDKLKVPNYIDVSRISVPKDYFLPDDWITMMKKFTSGGTPETPMEIKQMGGENKETLEAAKILLDMREKGYEIKNDAEGAPPTKTQLTKGSMLEKMRREAQSKIMFGDAPVDSYDEFIKEYHAAGYDKIVQEVNEWYSSMHKE